MKTKTLSYVRIFIFNSRIRTKIQRQINTTDKKIDDLVYDFYGLTEEEIAIVEIIDMKAKKCWNEGVIRMEYKKAIEIISKLAEGIDPFTGEVFEKDSPYQNACMVRALYTAIESLNKDARRSERQKRLPIRAGKPWDKDESDMLVKKFSEGVNISELARQHQRTTGAIESQLIRLGELTPRNYIKNAESL